MFLRIFYYNKGPLKNLKNVLPGLEIQGVTGDSHPESSFQMKINLAFHLEREGPVSKEKVEKQGF